VKSFMRVATTHSDTYRHESDVRDTRRYRPEHGGTVAEFERVATPAETGEFGGRGGHPERSISANDAPGLAV
jgi:hypothetical protein